MDTARDTEPAEIAALAERVVQQASDLCRDEDHLSRVIGGLDLPLDHLQDGYERTPSHGYELEPILRVFLYKHAGEYSDNELASELETWPYLLMRFDLGGIPTQQTLSYTWRHRFDNDLRTFLSTAGRGIREEALEQGVLRESPSRKRSDDEGHSETSSSKELTEARIRRVMRAARDHVFPAFDTGRAANATYSDECILSMQAYLSMVNCGSDQATRRFSRMSHREQTPHGDTLLRVIKKLGKPTDRQSTLGEYNHTGKRKRTEPWARVFEEIQEGFSTATENIIEALKETKPFREPVVAAIDITDTVFYPSPWEDYDAGIPRPDFPATVNGLKEPGERGYQFATLTIIGTNAPIILAVEPVKANSMWEDDDATNTPRAEIVDRLVSEAEQYVDIHMVMADREFDGHQVLHTLNEHDVTYLIPKKKYTDDLEGVSKVEEHPISDVGVEPDVELWLDGELSHEVNFMYVPSRNEDGKYTVFLTNRDGVEPEDVRGLCARYDRRWEIENEYKQIKKVLPMMASTDYRVRLFNFVFACILYNIWRLTDYLLKAAVGIDVRAKPVVRAGEVAEIVAEFLREPD